jgi:16S rRNA (cytosine1402-N4)-methyltransferase
MTTQAHTPVLLESVVEMVRAIKIQGGTFVDATFGRGGHTKEILRARPDIKILGLDCDTEAIDYGRENFKSEISAGRLELRHQNFSDFSCESEKIIGALLDLGVSSPQLDEGRRGFSFYHDGPLDMRMNSAQEVTASYIVNNWSEDDLNNLFRNLGEIRHPFRVTKKIVEARKEKAFSTTGELAFLVERAEGWHKKGYHPATNYFMALRIEVNQELARVEKAVPIFANCLQPEGRLLVITFHSLEDRLVKVGMKSLAESGVGILVNKKVIQAVWQEKKSNPRSRSAKLRVFERKAT